MDPWVSQKEQTVGSNTGEPVADLEDQFHLSSKTEGNSVALLSFPDNFEPASFQKLPDSQQYLASLEKKLQRIQSGGENTGGTLLRSLEQSRESCMVNLLTDTVVEGRSIEEDSFDSIKVNPLLKKFAPERQAIATEELVHLVKADQLELLLNTEQSAAVTEEVVSDSSQVLPQE